MLFCTVSFTPFFKFLCKIPTKSFVLVFHPHLSHTEQHSVSFFKSNTLNFESELRSPLEFLEVTLGADRTALGVIHPVERLAELAEPQSREIIGPEKVKRLDRPTPLLFYRPSLCPVGSVSSLGFFSHVFINNSKSDHKSFFFLHSRERLGKHLIIGKPLFHVENFVCLVL